MEGGVAGQFRELQFDCRFKELQIQSYRFGQELEVGVSKCTEVHGFALQVRIGLEVTDPVPRRIRRQ